MFQKSFNFDLLQFFQSYIAYDSTIWSFTSQKKHEENLKKFLRLLTLHFSDYHKHVSPKYLKVQKTTRYYLIQYFKFDFSI